LARRAFLRLIPVLHLARSRNALACSCHATALKTVVDKVRNQSRHGPITTVPALSQREGSAPGKDYRARRHVCSTGACRGGSLVKPCSVPQSPSQARTSPPQWTLPCRLQDDSGTSAASASRDTSSSKRPYFAYMSLVLCMKLAGCIGSADRPKGITSAY
jgi:hypothetical protein